MSDALETTVLQAAERSYLINERDPEGLEPIRYDQDESCSSSPTPAFQIPSNSPPRTNGHRQSEATNTGPKGVLADWRASRENQNLPSSPSTSNSSDSESDVSAIEAYRRQRLEELRKGSAERVALGSKAFGHLREIGVDQFEVAVLGEDSTTKVVLHLYEPEMPSCTRLNTHLSSIARAYLSTKFLRARASHVDFALDAAHYVLPTILVYQGGELINNLVAFDRQWGKRSDFSEADVRFALARHGAITLKAGEMIPPLQEFDLDEDDEW